MDKSEIEIARGERARQLLEDPLLVEAFTKKEAEYIQAWLNSPARDVEGREALYLSIKNLHAIRGHLSNVMDTGTMAKATLAQRTGQTLKRVFSA